MDKEGQEQDSCEADIPNGDTAIRWMRIVSAAWGLHRDWSSIELWCQGRCIARARMEFIGDQGNPGGLGGLAREALPQ